MTDYQKIIDTLILEGQNLPPVKMQKGGAANRYQAMAEAERTGGLGRGTGAGSYAPIRDTRPKMEPSNEDTDRPTPLTQAELKNLRTSTGAKQFPAGLRPVTRDQLDKIREIQAAGLKFGNYADDTELFKRMLENSGIAQKLGTTISRFLSEGDDPSIRRFVYDPETEKIRAFESEAPMGGLAGLAMSFLGKDLTGNKKPMVFTGDQDLNFIKSSKDIVDNDEMDQIKDPMDPCPPGFVLIDGVCTPIIEEPAAPEGIPDFQNEPVSMFAQGGMVDNLEAIQNRAQEFSDFVSSKISGGMSGGNMNLMQTPPASLQKAFLNIGPNVSAPLPGMPTTVASGFQGRPALQDMPDYRGPPSVGGGNMSPQNQMTKDFGGQQMTGDMEMYRLAQEDARRQREAGFRGRVMLPGEGSFEDFMNMRPRGNLLSDVFNSGGIGSLI